MTLPNEFSSRWQQSANNFSNCFLPFRTRDFPDTDDIASGRLIQIMANNEVPRQVYVVSLPRRQIASTEHAFIDHLMKQMEDGFVT
jgi:hypothetical protein